ncbi:MAG: filamentous hemagglutinin N-terminal domain-containing protein [Nitrospira sp.]|nr:filamentous hemagglutinin N-terminal domain-containing protein [Nitrospira sp.]
MMNDIVKAVCAVRLFICRCRLHVRREAIGRACVAILVGICLGTPGPATANPVGLNSPTSGVAFSGVGTPNVTITSSALRSIVNAQGFDIASNETTSVLQAANAAMLVRIGSLNPTSIQGQLNAMGTLVLINPNGVFFGAGSQINVNGLIVSSLNMTDGNFLNGRYLFEGAATAGMVRNDGQIVAGSQGVYLLAPNTMNVGGITSSGGPVALAAGTTAYLSDRADGRGFLVEVKAPAGEALNLGRLVATDGGQLSMIGRLVTQSGLVQANSVQRQNGKIKLVASEQATLGATGRTVADGGEVSVSGRAIEQQGLVQSIGTPTQSGRVELVASERVNLRAGSQTIVKGGETDISDGGTIAAMATNATTGTVTIEDGAVLDIAHGVSGGSRGEVWLGGASVARPAVITGLVDGDVHTIPRTRTVTASDLAADSPRSYSNFYALDNLMVNVSSFNLASRAMTPATTGTARIGTLRFFAGNDLLVNNTNIQNGQNSGIGAAIGWNLVGTAKNDIVFNTATWSTSAGGSISLDATRDIKLVPDGGGGLTTLRTFTGGDIAIHAGRDLMAPFARPTGIVQYAGIRLQGTGNLSITTGRDFLGGIMAAAPAGPGFLLSDGRAVVSVGGNVGSVYAPGTPNPAGPQHGYANVLLGGGTLDLATGQVEQGSQRAARVNIVTGGNIYLGNAMDSGSAEGFGRGAFDALTVHPNSEVRLTSYGGDIFLNPLGITLDQPSTAVLPPTFIVNAPNGSISIQSQLDFWPSTTGNLALTAGNSIEGTVGEAGFVSTTIGLCRLCPNIGIRPSTQPPSFSLVTNGGDIKDLKLELANPAVTRTVTISSGRDIANVFGTIAVPDRGSSLSVTITAKRNIDFTGQLDANGNEIVDPTGSGFLFGGTGLVKLTAGGNLNLAKSFGLRYQSDPEQPTIDADQGGLLDVAVGENLIMDRSRIITNNGAGLFIHGPTANPPVGATTATATSTTLNGNPVYVVGGQVVRDVAGHPVVVGANDVIVGKEVLVVDGTPVLSINGKPIVIDRMSSETVTAGDVVHGTAVLDRPLVQLPDGTMLLMINGKAVFSSAPGGGPTEGRPSVSNGAVTLMVGGNQVTVVEPLGGTVNVGTASNTVTDQTGILTVRGGSVDLKATKNIEVNLSRIATLGGGNITLTSTTGDINAGTGSITDITQFPIQEQRPDGTVVTTLFAVPGSGIFTFHPRDGNLPNVPVFDPISPLETRVILHRFLGHDVSELEPLLPDAREAWKNQYEQRVSQLFAGFRLGDIDLTAAHNVIVPPAGIRGRNVTINAGHDLELQGGAIRGIATVNVGGQVIGSLSAFQGVFTVNLGGIAGGSPGTTLGLGSITGGIGTVTTSSAVMASTSAVSVTGSKAAAEAQSTQPVTESRAVADRTGKKGGGQSTQGSLRIRDKVRIKVETKPEDAT